MTTVPQRYRQTDGRTDRRTTYCCNTAVKCVKSGNNSINLRLDVNFSSILDKNLNDVFLASK